MALNYALWRHEEKGRRTEKKIDEDKRYFHKRRAKFKSNFLCCVSDFINPISSASSPKSKFEEQIALH